MAQSLIYGPEYHGYGPVLRFYGPSNHFYGPCRMFTAPGNTERRIIWRTLQFALSVIRGGEWVN